MPKNWKKGFTKETHPSIMKTSLTMKKRGIDNFAKYRERMRKAGKIKSYYPRFEKNGDLAELIGVVLGDGSIHAFQRTEGLRIISNSNNLGFAKRYSDLIEKVFNKRPSCQKIKGKNAIRITVYEKYISKRLGIPTGNRSKVITQVPSWILNNRDFVVRYLRGLYEAEGSHCVHKPTSTYKVFFSNHNDSLLDIVFRLVSSLGFHPHKSKYQVQISRKKEVYDFMDLIQFRKY